MSLAVEAKTVYSTLKQFLESEHFDEYVAIEPKSKTHFIGKTFVEAALAAKRALPEQRSFVIRIGREAAFHIGAGST